MRHDNKCLFMFILYNIHPFRLKEKTSRKNKLSLVPCKYLTIEMCRKKTIIIKN